MAVCYTTWTVNKHKPIEKLAPNLWRVAGIMENGTRRIMSVIRLADGRVLMHNAIALDEAEMAEIDGWGEVSGILVPNAFHRMDSRIMHQRYPKAKVYCPGNAVKAVGKATEVAGSYADTPGDATVKVRHLAGLKENEGVVEVQTDAGPVFVFNDMIMNMPKMGYPMELFIGPSGQASVPRFARWVWVKDKVALRKDLDGLAAMGPVRVIPGHGADIVEDVGRKFREAIGLV